MLIVANDQREAKPPAVELLSRVGWAVGWACVAAGGVLIVLAYLGASRQAIVAKQIPYLVSGGLGGLAFVGVGGALLIAERTAAHTAAVERQLMQLVDLLTEPIEPIEGGLVAVPGGQWYHRPDCQLARDKPGVEALTPAEIAKQGLTPCPVCAPQLSAPQPSEPQPSAPLPAAPQPSAPLPSEPQPSEPEPATETGQLADGP